VARLNYYVREAREEKAAKLAIPNLRKGKERAICMNSGTGTGYAMSGDTRVLLRTVRTWWKEKDVCGALARRVAKGN